MSENWGIPSDLKRISTSNLWVKVTKDLVPCSGGDSNFKYPAPTLDGNVWTAGAWTEEQPVELCAKGYHLTRQPWDWVQRGNRLDWAEGRGDHTGDGNKTAFASVRLLRPVTLREAWGWGAALACAVPPILWKALVARALIKKPELLDDPAFVPYRKDLDEVLDRFRRGKALPADKRPAAYRLSYDRSLTASVGELAHLLTDRLPPFHWYQEKVGPLRDALERVAGWILDEPLTVNIKTLEIVRKRT